MFRLHNNFNERLNLCRNPIRSSLDNTVPINNVSIVIVSHVDKKNGSAIIYIYCILCDM